MALKRLAMIGARGHTNYVLLALPELPEVRIVAVAEGSADDPATNVLKWCSENGHEPRTFTDWRKMLDDVPADAVVVCGPFELHAAMSIAAIERGMHVFVEKPAALTLDDLAKLRAAHEKHPNIHTAGMMGIRYDPGFYTAWNLVREGAIGDVRLLNARKSYKLGKRPAYYHERSTYGGTISWVGSHAIDWVLWMSMQPVRSIYATQSTACNEGHGTMERAAGCHFALAGGRSAEVSIDVFRPGNATTHGDDWIRIVGTQGVIEARPGSVSLINSSNDGTQPVPVSSDRQVFREFVDHIDGRRKALIDAQQTLVLTEVCLLAQKSADEDGEVIRIPEQRQLGFKS